MHVLDESINIGANLHCLWLIFHRVGSISVHDTFGTKGGRFWYMPISVQTMSRSVHGNSAYATSVHRQYNFGTQFVHQEYDFGTCLERCEKQRVL